MICFFLITIKLIICMMVTLFVLDSLNYTFFIIDHLSIIKVAFRILFQFSSVQLLSCVWLLATPWTAARRASLSIFIRCYFSQYFTNVLYLKINGQAQFLYTIIHKQLITWQCSPPQVGDFGQHSHPTETIVHCLQTFAWVSISSSED